MSSPFVGLSACSNGSSVGGWGGQHQLASASGYKADADYRVEQMKHGKNGKDKDLSTLHYNAKITLRGIPLEAYEYVVNGKPALGWWSASA